MNQADTNDYNLPEQQFLSPDAALLEMAAVGAKRAQGLSSAQVLILSMLAGGFITIGALFSVLIAAGTHNPGVQRLLEGFGFSVGFFLVVITGTLLFTEVNVELPATFLSHDVSAIRSSILKLWVLAALGNLIGAFVTGQVIMYAHDYDAEFDTLLAEIVDSKLRYQDIGGIEGFFKAIVSGVLANWLVGMAALLSVMGRTIIGKYVPVFLVVTAFVASGFLHSPAN
ncbi:MAG: formate/nitrite transporter family protein, partial [Acidimicrobiales bacterium]